MRLFEPASDTAAEDAQIAKILGVELSAVSAQRGALANFDNADGPKLWPSSVAFAKMLTSGAMASQVKGCDIIELGAGLGGVGIAAALAGANSVLLTDFQPGSLALAEAAAEANGVGDIVSTRLLDWTSPPPTVEELGGVTYDLVLASDVLYSRELTMSLLDVVASLLLVPKELRARGRPEARALIVDPPDRPCRVLLPEECARRGLYWGGELPVAEAELDGTALINVLRA